MIEPKHYISREEVERLIKPGESIFAITDGSVSYFHCVALFQSNQYGDVSREFITWVGPDNKIYHSTGGLWISGAEFMDYLMTNHQEYAVWFLFHPEWL